MKKAFFLLITVLFCAASYSQVLFTYGPYKVTTAEFLQAYNKNKSLSQGSTQDMRDYLDLYTKFKIKVRAAYDMRLDTLASLKADLQHFRSQVQANYLKDEAETNRLVNEAFERSQKDIHTVYYFLPAGEGSNAAKDSSLMEELGMQLKKNPGDEEGILMRLNKGSRPIQKNDAGYITVFDLPYEMENRVYNLSPGKISSLYHNSKGWFLFKNAGERKAVGKITVAQILFAIQPGYTQRSEEIKKLADSVYTALQNGADFAALARQYSDDRSTYYNGGVLPEFGTARYDSIFENHAFALVKDGDISRPFKTAFGYHILKRISASPVPVTRDNETFMYDLRQQVLHDSRIQDAEKKFIETITRQIGYRKIHVDEKTLWAVTDSSLMNSKNVTIKGVNEYTNLLTFNNKATVKVRDWILFINNSGTSLPLDTHRFYESLFPEFVKQSIIANYAARMEDFNPAFKSQMNEFKDGNMLFEVMQRKVWDKASSDSVGLFAYYEKNREKYKWNSSAAAIIFSCENKEMTDSAVAALKSGRQWREILSEHPSKIQADSGRYELGQIPVIDRTYFTEGLITAPVVNKNDGSLIFAQIIKLYPGQQQRNFEDARGLVINDYQNYLEDQWIAGLEKKYPVKINEQVWQQLVK